MIHAKGYLCVLNKHNVSIHIYNKYINMETVDLLSELRFNKRKKGPRVVESLTLGHTALGTWGPFCPWPVVWRGVAG